MKRKEEKRCVLSSQELKKNPGGGVSKQILSAATVVSAELRNFPLLGLSILQQKRRSSSITLMESGQIAALLLFLIRS